MSVELGSLLGAVLAEVTRARLAADLETVRMADIYAGDALLKQLPIPRFRLPNVEVEVPVVLDEVEGEGATPAPPKLPSATRRENFLKAALLQADLPLKPAERKHILTALTAETERIERAPGPPLAGRQQVQRLQRVAERALAETLAERSGDPPSPEITRAVIGVLGGALQGDYNRQLSRLYALKILPRTQDVQSQPDSSRVMHLRFTIAEESYQLAIGEDDQGTITETFTPE